MITELISYTINIYVYQTVALQCRCPTCFNKKKQTLEMRHKNNGFYNMFCVINK